MTAAKEIQRDAQKLLKAYPHVGLENTVANHALAAVERIKELERENAESEAAHRWLIWFTNSLRWKDFMRSRGCPEEQVSEVEQLREPK